MIDPPSDGDLLAYLDGADLPEVEYAVQNDPDARHRLEVLREADARMRALFAPAAEPELADPQDLVDVATNQATPAQRLIVAAYLRRSEEGRNRMRALQQAAAAAQEAEGRDPAQGEWRLPCFFALPTPAAGIRAAEPERPHATTAFYVAELQAQIILVATPPVRERWHLEGHVTQGGHPAQGAYVALEQAGWRSATTTGKQGFFTFVALEPGDYRLVVEFEQGSLIIPEITLSDE